MKPYKFIWILCCMGIGWQASAQKQQVIKGNQFYQEKKYKEAAESYQEALVKQPAYTPGIFNLGNALLQQKQYDAARKTMDAAARQADNPSMKANARYNIGNSYMEEQKWEEAIESYKEALRNNPGDEAAKYNLSYARAMLKKEQGEGGKDQQQNQEDQQKDQQQQNQENKDQNQDKQENPQQSPQEQNQKEEREDNKPAPQPSKLTEQQAEQLLNALAQEEKKLHEKKEKEKGIPVKTDKDW